MNPTLIRYRTRPERADENERLVKAVFAELKAKKPAGLHYLVLRLEDETFVHLVASEGDNPIGQMDAFRSFQNGIRDRCLEPPQSKRATIVGNYRMLDDGEPIGR